MPTTPLALPRFSTYDRPDRSQETTADAADICPSTTGGTGYLVLYLGLAQPRGGPLMDDVSERFLGALSALQGCRSALSDMDW